MAEQGGSGSSVKLVAIIAIVILVGGAAWFFMGQRSRQAATSTANAPASEKKADIQVDIDLPDSVTIKR